MMFECIKCGASGTAELFEKKGKFRKRCKTCVNSRQRAYNAANPDIISAVTKRVWLTKKSNPEALAMERKRLADYAKTAKGRASRMANNRTEKRKSYAREYYAGYVMKPGEKERRAAYKKTPMGIASTKNYNHRRRLQCKGGISTARLREILDAADLCRYCRCEFTEQRPKTIDHVIALSRGGGHSEGNIVICCKSCNSSKCASLPEEWEKRRAS